MSCEFRKNVVGVVLNKENKIFIARKSPSEFKMDIINDEDIQKRQNYWQFPQGGIDEGEDMVVAAKREVEEETGMRDLELYKASTRTHTYEWRNAMRSLWVNRNHQAKGQMQHIVYFKYLGSHNDIQLPTREEFTDYQWVPVSSLTSIIHLERHPVVKIVQEDLKDLV